MRDYDFSVLLLEHNKDQSRFSVPENFGELHGNIFKDFVQSSAWRANFSKAPVICLSVSSKDVYHRTGNEHPVLGIEYAQEGVSLTERYFSKMGLQVRYFMPKTASRRWPLFYRRSAQRLHQLELIATISTMETFQKIYRPEIYNANSGGAILSAQSQPPDHSLTKIVYDREERSLLAIEQGNLHNNILSTRTRRCLSNGLLISRFAKPI